MFAVAVAALGFSSCSETWDDNPVLNTHEGEVKADFLNNPQMQDQVIMLTNDNKDGNFHLTCSQPDFGYAAVGTYRVQCSLTEDFAKFEEISQDFYDCSQINPLNGDVAAVLEKLAGVQTDADLPLPEYKRLYMRLRAFVAQDEANTQFLSNVVSFKGVNANYLAIWVAGVPVNLYMRGGMNEWGATPGSEWQFVTGPEENTWVLPNVTILANTSIKVSTDSWGSPNLGGNAGENEASQMINPGEEYAMTQGDNPGHMRMDVDFTGKVVLRLENGIYYITFDPAR